MDRFSRPIVLVVLLSLLVAVSALIPALAAAQSGADVAASMTSDSLTGKFGEPMTFVLTATNVGDETATDVTMLAGLPDWFNYVSHTCSKGTTFTNLPRCDIATLAPGESASLTLVVTPIPAVKGDRHVFENGVVDASNDVNPDNRYAEVRVQIGYCHKGVPCFR